MARTHLVPTSLARKLGIDTRFPAWSGRLARKRGLLVAGCWCLVASVSLAACSYPAGATLQPVRIEVTPGTADAQIRVEAHPERATIEIISPSGIGRASFSVSGVVPKEIGLQLHLRGLEQLVFAYDEVTIVGSISSAPGNAVHETIKGAAGGGEQALQPDSSYWVPMRIVASPATIPLDEGYIEVEAPTDFLRGDYRSFSIEWIDFFR